MTKYVTRSAWSQQHDEYNVTMTADTVIDSDRMPQKTGLLDQTGMPLYRVEDTVEFGYRSRK